MGFTIKCNKCGTEQEFKQFDKARNTKIDIEVNLNNHWDCSTVDYITIYCENPDCINNIDLNY